MRDRGKYELFIYHSCFYSLVSGMGAARLYPSVPKVGLCVFPLIIYNTVWRRGKRNNAFPCKGFGKVLQFNKLKKFATKSV